MKVIGFTCLHYGTDYLGWAIRSVIDHVDEHHIIYSPVGSHGHHTERRCPDTRDELYAIAKRAAGSKLVWSEGRFPHEGAHRSHIHVVAPDADVILVVDADEIWPVGMAETILALPANGAPVRRIRVSMVHFWRSFYRAVLHDPAWPHRVLYPKVEGDHEYALSVAGNIAHMGYAQRPEIVRYKLETHGHKNEFRQDQNWFGGIFMDEKRRNDLHPVGSDYWNYEDVDPWQHLPEFMKSHPYANMDIIR